MTGLTVFFGFLVVAGIVLLVGTVVVHMLDRSAKRPDQELSYARMLLVQVLAQDDLMPQLPTELRDSIKRFINSHHRGLNR